MKRGTLYKLHTGIKNCGNLSGEDNSEFIYRAGLMFMEIDKRVQLFEKSRPVNSEQYDAYNDEHTKLMYKYALKDDNGVAITQGMDVALSNPLQYKVELSELVLKYKDVIKEHKDKTKEFDNFLDREMDDFNFAPIPRKYIPKEMTLTQMLGIVELLEK